MSENEKNAYSLMTYRVMVGNTFPYYVLPNSKNFYMIPEAAKAMGDLLTYHYNQTEEQLLVRAGYQQESSVTNGNYDQQIGLSASIDNDMDVSLKSDTCKKLILEGVKFGFIQRFFCVAQSLLRIFLRLNGIVKSLIGFFYSLSSVGKGCLLRQNGGIFSGI